MLQDLPCPRLRRLLLDTLFLLQPDVRDLLWERIASVVIVDADRLAGVYRRQLFPPRYAFVLSARLSAFSEHDESIQFILAHELAHLLLLGNRLEDLARGLHTGELAAWQAMDDDPSSAEGLLDHGLASATIQDDPAAERAADRQVWYGWGLRPHPEDRERFGLHIPS